MAIPSYKEEKKCEYCFILDSCISAKNWGSVTIEKKKKMDRSMTFPLSFKD